MKLKLNDHDVKDIIRYARENAGITQKELGKILSKSERTIHQYETGKRSYTIQTFKDICEKLNLEVTIQNKKSD